MKKIIISMLAVLLLLSFTGCDTQKKINDALDKQKDTLISFRDTYDAAKRYNNVIYEAGKQLENGASMEYVLSDFNSKDKSEEEKKTLETAIYMLLNSSNSKYARISYTASSKKVESATGTVKVEKSEDGAYTLRAEGVDIRATYNSSDGETEVNATLSLDGVIYQKDNNDEETGEETFNSKVTGFRQNGAQYKDIEYSVTSKQSTDGAAFSWKVIFTKAICGENNVDLDIINRYWQTY